MSKPPRKPNPSAPLAATHSQVTATFSGPLPLPETLERYNRIVPGAAERILAMAEADAKHLQALELASLAASQEEARRRHIEARHGQIYGLCIGLTALATSALALVLGYEQAAVVIGGTTVVGLVAVFVVGRFKGSS